jgi:hypothetical protein
MRCGGNNEEIREESGRCAESFYLKTVGLLVAVLISLLEAWPAVYLKLCSASELSQSLLLFLSIQRIN